MPQYYCNLCNFSSTLKGNHKRHLTTNKHIRNVKELALKSTKEHKRAQKEHKRAQKSTKEHKKNNENSQSLIVFSEKMHKCQYCDDTFTTFSNKRRHELHYCKEIPNTSQNVIISLKNEKKQLYKQIEKLIDKSGNTNNVTIHANSNNTNNSTNTTNTQNTKNTMNTMNTTNTQNIKLNSYGKEDLSHITDLFKTNLLKIPYGMIPKMIEAVHFNDNKPENKNIQFTNKRDNKIKVFSNDKWIHKSKDETIHDLMDGKYFILDTHYSKIIDADNPDNPDTTKTINILDFYEKFRQLFDERDKKLMEDQRKECELVLLNNR